MPPGGRSQSSPDSRHLPPGITSSGLHAPAKITHRFSFDRRGSKPHREPARATELSRILTFALKPHPLKPGNQETGKPENQDRQTKAPFIFSLTVIPIDYI